MSFLHRCCAGETRSRRWVRDGRASRGRGSANTGVVPAPALHVDGSMGVLAHFLPPLVVLKSTAVPPTQSLAVTHPCSGSRKNACSSPRSGGGLPGTRCTGVMSVHVFPKSCVATRRWWHRDGSVAMQCRTMATPNDLDTSWNASTLVVRAVEPGDDRSPDGAELWAGVDERARGLDPGAEVVHDAAVTTAITKPAKRIFDGTGGTPLGQATLAHERHRPRRVRMPRSGPHVWPCLDRVCLGECILRAPASRVGVEAASTQRPELSGDGFLLVTTRDLPEVTGLSVAYWVCTRHSSGRVMQDEPRFTQLTAGRCGGHPPLGASSRPVHRVRARCTGWRHR